MSQESETLLFQVIVDIPKVKENAEVARAALANLRAEKEKTQKVFDQKLIGEETYKKTLQALTVEINKTEKELADYTKIIVDHDRQEKIAVGTIRQLATNMSALAPKANEIANLHKQGASSAEQLNDQIRDLNNQFKIEEAVAKAAEGSLEDLDNTIADLEDQYRQLTKAQRDDVSVGGALLKQRADLIRVQEKHNKVISDSEKGLVEFIRDTDVLGFNIGKTIDAFKSGAQGVNLFTKFLGTARLASLAFIATGLGAVLFIIATALTKSQKGMDFLARATSGVSAIFSAFTSKVIALGEALANAWEHPKQALADFGKFVQQNLINRFTALGVIIDGIRTRDWGKVADGIVQLGTGAEGAATGLKKIYDQGVAIADLNIQIKEAEIKLNTERARGEKIIERQKQIAEDLTKSTEVRKKAERIAFAESEKIQKAEEDLQKKRVLLAQAEAKANQNTREDRAKVAEEQAKLDDIAKERIGERTELQNQLNAIEAEGRQKAEENAKKLAADQVAEAETALSVLRKKGQTTIEIEEEVLRRQLALIRAKAAAEKIGAEVSVAQKRLIDAKAQEEELEAIKAHAQKIEQQKFAIQDARISAQLALVEKGSQQEFDLLNQALDARLDREKAAAVETIKNQQVLIAELRRLDAQYNADKEQLAIQYEQSLVDRQAELASKRLQTQYNLSDQTIADERELAAKQIALEERTQLALLEIDRKYERITNEEYLVRKNAIQSKAIAANKAANKQVADDTLSNEIAMIDAQLIIAQDGSKKKFDLEIKRLEKEKEQKIKAARGDQQAIDTIEEEYANKQAKKREERALDMANKIVNVFAQAGQAFASFLNAQNDAQAKALEDQEKAALSSAALSAEARADIEANFQKKKEKLEREAAKKRKTIAIAEAIIDTAKAVLSVAPNVALMAIAGAIGALQIGIISSQQFARGGVIEGPSHAQGGVKYVVGSRRVELEGGEGVINKHAMAIPGVRQKASELNQMAGNGVAFTGLNTGRSYAPKRLEFGGIIPASPGVSSSLSNLDFGKLEKSISQTVIKGVAQAVSSMPQPILNVKDVIRETNKRVSVQNRADS
ncbi:hypothetical protein [Spirosoma panaciterrae]|uniref:hypothetical protein n=1 Tax=Spirosoma panaciterrae TaxID=496058 RepID=UPI000376AE20|nr:hypothetical protein [Spirosoma panaciterrae]